jgi:thioredoxin 1
MKMSVLKINKENFEILKNERKPVLIDFYADWCGPCRMVSPIIDEIASERDDIVVAKVNVDENRELANEFSVYSIPSLFVLRNGEVVSRMQGAKRKAEILSMLDG